MHQALCRMIQAFLILTIIYIGLIPIFHRRKQAQRDSVICLTVYDSQITKSRLNLGFEHLLKYRFQCLTLDQQNQILKGINHLGECVFLSSTPGDFYEQAHLGDTSVHPVEKTTSLNRTVVIAKGNLVLVQVLCTHDSFSIILTTAFLGSVSLMSHFTNQEVSIERLMNLPKITARKWQDENLHLAQPRACVLGSCTRNKYRTSSSGLSGVY